MKDQDVAQATQVFTPIKIMFSLVMHFHCRTGSILRGKEEDFCKELMELSEQAEFNIMSFEAVVDKIRIYVAEVSFFCPLVSSTVSSVHRKMSN